MIAGLLKLALVASAVVPVQHPDPDEHPPPFPSFTITPDGVVLEKLPSSQIVSLAAQEYAMGVKFRHNADGSRKRFREAARMYDAVWNRGYRDANLALNRANARRLAGDLPGAIVALNDGLAAAPWSRPLQAALEDARSAVAYPVHGELESLCRPAPHTTIGTRMSPAEARWIAAGLWLLACIGVARFAMTRAAAWLAFSAVWLAALAVLGVLWWQDDRVRRADNEYPLVVVKENVDLLRGNSRVFPKRLDTPPFPRGVEARELARRGGWVQIRLHGGVIGWIPEAAVLKSGG